MTATTTPSVRPEPRVIHPACPVCQCRYPVLADQYQEWQVCPECDADVFDDSGLCDDPGYLEGGNYGR